MLLIDPHSDGTPTVINHNCPEPSPKLLEWRHDDFGSYLQFLSEFRTRQNTIQLPLFTPVTID